MSASGITPPPNTSTSPRPRAAQLLHDPREQRQVGARQQRQPDGVGVLLQHRLGDLLGRLVQAGVDDLEPGVAQRPRDRSCAPVVAVETGLGHDDAVGPVHGTRTLRGRRCAAPTLSRHTWRRGRTPPPITRGARRRAGPGRPRRAGAAVRLPVAHRRGRHPATRMKPTAASAPTSSKSATSTAWPTPSSATARSSSPT